MLAFRGLWSVSKGRSAFDRHRALVIITFLTFAFFFPSHKAPLPRSKIDPQIEPNPICRLNVL